MGIEEDLVGSKGAMQKTAHMNYILSSKLKFLDDLGNLVQQ